VDSKRCIDPATGDMHDIGVIYLTDPPLVMAALIQRAVSQLRMPQPVIAANRPWTGPQVVPRSRSGVGQPGS